MARTGKKSLSPVIPDIVKHRMIEGLRSGMAYEPLMRLCGYYESEVAIVRAQDTDFNRAMQNAADAGLSVNRLDLYVSLIADGFGKRPAMRLAGVTQVTIHFALGADHTLAQRISEAEEHSTELLEREAFKRAIDGSDLLLMFLLKARKPDRYRDNPALAPPPPDDPAVLDDDFKLAARTAFLLSYTRQQMGSKQIDAEANPDPVPEAVKHDDP